MSSSPSTPAGPSVTETNRRSFPRVSSNCVVDFRPVGDDPEFQKMQTGASGLVQNISGGGVCVRMHSDPGAGALLALDIHLPMFSSSVMALGKVAWSEVVGESGECDVGIEFWWVGWSDPGAQEEIRRFISEKLRQS